MEGALHAGFDDWTHWLPCDSVIALQTPNVHPPVPYTRVMAHDAGWQWRIPLQHRTGNGIVYCSRYLDKDAALDRMLGNIAIGSASFWVSFFPYFFISVLAVFFKKKIPY